MSFFGYFDLVDPLWMLHQNSDICFKHWPLKKMHQLRHSSVYLLYFICISTLLQNVRICGLGTTKVHNKA